MLQHGGRVLLADEMGLGKTLQVLKYQHFLFSLYFCWYCTYTIFNLRENIFCDYFWRLREFFFGLKKPSSMIK